MSRTEWENDDVENEFASIDEFFFNSCHLDVSPLDISLQLINAQCIEKKKKNSWILLKDTKIYFCY